MKKHNPSFRPALERLEDRRTPAGNVAASLSLGTLTLTGDFLANNIDISQIGFQSYEITGNATTVSFGGAPMPAGTPVPISGVTNITVNMSGGDDTVTFGNQSQTPMNIVGALSINGGTGNNRVLSNPTSTAAFFLTVNGNFSITNAGGNDTNLLLNLRVVHSLTINNGDGDSVTVIATVAARQSNFIIGNLTIMNGAGRDDNTIQDTFVGGNLTINNGTAALSSNQAGSNEISTRNLDNVGNSHVRIGGNVMVTNLSGDNLTNFFDDLDVGGNFSVNTGSGNGQTTDFTASSTPETVGGSLTFRGTGQNFVGFGDGTVPGMLIGLLNVAFGGGDDVVLLRDVFVRTTTTIATGGGMDMVTIDDFGARTGSTFVGNFFLNTGDGNDMVMIQFGQPEDPTSFYANVSISLGAGNDMLSMANNGMVNFFTNVTGAVRIDGGAGLDTYDITVGNLFFIRVPVIVNFP